LINFTDYSSNTFEVTFGNT